MIPRSQTPKVFNIQNLGELHGPWNMGQRKLRNVRAVQVIFHSCHEAWNSLWSSKLHPHCVPISLKIELYIFPAERELPFVFWQCFSYCLYLNILIIQAHGYTQPSQLIFTSSATVSGDPARVTSWTKGSKNPPSGHGSQYLSQNLFRESDCNWADMRSCPQSLASLRLLFDERSKCLKRKQT